MKPITRALISVTDKSGLPEFARFLADHHIEILSTGGTAKLLRDNGIAVTEVSTSPDLKYAKIFVSSIGGQAEEQQVLSALNSAAGFMRSALAKRMKMRYTPELHFAWDSSIEHGDKVLRLLDQIDAEKK